MTAVRAARRRAALPRLPPGPGAATCRTGAWPRPGASSAGSSARWRAARPSTTLDAEAEAAGPGAGGVVALPYLLGEKTPINDPEARGAFTGLRLDHTRGHLFRAVLEATAFGFRHHLDVFAELGYRPARVRTTNGGARSRLWKQVVADVVGYPLEALAEAAGSELGAAFAAGMGVGVFRDWGEIERFVAVADTVEPDPRAQDAYAELYSAYRGAVPGAAARSGSPGRGARARRVGSRA